MQNYVATNDVLPVPVPSAPDDILPQSSESKLIAQTNIPVFVHCDDNWHRFSDKFGQYISTSDPLFLAPDSAPHYARFQPAFPANVQLAYLAHWELVESFSLTGPTDFDRSVTWTRGSSTTDTTSFSAELGASAGGISAKLSASTSHSVTVTESGEETQTFHFNVPKGVVRVIAFWQLVEIFRFVDASGNPATYRGLWRIYDQNGDGNQALAWLDSNQIVNRALTLRVSQTDF